MMKNNTRYGQLSGTPNGWRKVGKSGTKAECGEYIKKVWTDMRPLSLRKKMAEQGLG